jgi:hypothetical protein
VAQSTARRRGAEGAVGGGSGDDGVGARWEGSGAIGGSGRVSGGGG